MVLDGLESVIHSSCPREGSKVNFIRYADDFIVTGANVSLLQNKVMPAIEKFLKPRGLELSPEKTKITAVESGFDFLGFNIRKYNGKFLSKPSKEGCKDFKQRIRAVIKGNYGKSARYVINELNPKIIGWANYYRGSAAKATYANIDNAIYKACIAWVMRKYNKRHRRKAVARYFRRRSATRGWIFSEVIKRKKTKRKLSSLKR